MECGDKICEFVLISMVPAAFIGLVFEEEIGALFEGQLLLIGAMLALTGLLLFLADRAKETRKSVQGIDAFVVGLAQAVAILPESLAVAQPFLPLFCSV